MGREAKLKAARRKSLANHIVQFNYDGKNYNTKVVRRFTMSDLEIKDWDATLKKDIFNGNTDIWIDFSGSTCEKHQIPLYFIDSGRFDNVMTVTRQHTWQTIKVNPEFEQSIVNPRDQNTLWFGITYNGGTLFRDYTLDEAYETFITDADKNDPLQYAIGNTLIKLFIIKEKRQRHRSLFFLVDSEEIGKSTNPMGSSIFFAS